MTWTPDIPGRDSWRLKGGLLPGAPGSLSKIGYYRLNVAPEKMVGNVWPKDQSDSAHCVNEGVKIIQRELNGQLGTTLDPDGVFGRLTDVAVHTYQKAHKLVMDGVVGPATMRVLLRPKLNATTSTYKVPVLILFGLCNWESGFDPASVGTNGWDHGIAQINLDPQYGWGDKVTWEQAMDPVYAFNFAAHDLQRVHDKWVGQTTADPWDIAIANHNNPQLAIQWATTGKAPLVFHTDGTPRVPQIGEYVSSVKQAGQGVTS